MTIDSPAKQEIQDGGWSQMVGKRFLHDARHSNGGLLIAIEDKTTEGTEFLISWTHF